MGLKNRVRRKLITFGLALLLILGQSVQAFGEVNNEVLFYLLNYYKDGIPAEVLQATTVDEMMEIVGDKYTKYFSQEDYNDYLDYQSIIKLDNRKIYLAKNNNFILRYKSVREFNDDFIMVILYRDPLTHAASLMEKHCDYKKLQKEDIYYR